MWHLFLYREKTYMMHIGGNSRRPKTENDNRNTMVLAGRDGNPATSYRKHDWRNFACNNIAECEMLVEKPDNKMALQMKTPDGR